MTNPNQANYFWAGSKVRLRGLRPEDAEAAYANSLDSPGRQVLQLGVELPTSIEALRIELEKRAHCRDVDGVIVFAIETLSGRYVGGISLHSRNEKNGTFGFGVNVHAAHRENGYAADAVRILLTYAFHERRYQKCNSACVEGNEASISLHRKLGFVEEGRRRRHLFLNGRFYDDILFGLTREEFDEVNASPA